MAKKLPFVLYQGKIGQIKDTDTIFDFTVVELDFGAIPIKWKKFSVTDSNIVSTDIVDCKLAYLQPTGKSLDEVEMDSFYIICKPKAGSIDFLIKSLEGHVKGKFKFRYQVFKG